MEVSQIHLLPRNLLLERLAQQRQWFAERMQHVHTEERPEPIAPERDPKQVAATYTPTAYAPAASFAMYTQTGALAQLMAQEGAPPPAPRREEDSPTRIAAVGASAGAHVESKL